MRGWTRLCVAQHSEPEPASSILSAGDQAVRARGGSTDSISAVFYYECAGSAECVAVAGDESGSRMMVAQYQHGKPMRRAHIIIGVRTSGMGRGERIRMNFRPTAFLARSRERSLSRGWHAAARQTPSAIAKFYIAAA